MEFDPNPALQQGRGTHRLNLAPALVSAIIALALYAVTLGGGYLYDDVPVVHDDQRLHHPNQWGRFWTTDYFDGGIDNLYRPLVSMSYAVEWWLHGDKPWIFHAVNILLHALVAAAVAEFTRRALSNSANARIAATCAGLLFAVHPIHVEAVANIVGRAELACGLAVLLSLILLCEQPMSRRRIAAIISIGFTGMLCKEQAILQPLFWLFLGLLLIRFQPASAVKLFVLLTSWLWAIYLIVREHLLKFEWDRTYMDPIIQPLIKSHGVDRLLMPIVLLGHYSALLFWPQHLSPDYGGDVIGSVAHFSDPFLWIGFIAICFGIATALWAARVGRRFTLFCMLGFSISYGVIGNIFTLIGTNFAERLIYLPSAFVLMAVGQTIAQLPRKIGLSLMGLIVVLGSCQTFTAARRWNNPTALYESGLQSQPRSFQLHLLLSQTYHGNGRIIEANALLADACKLYPNYWRAWLYRSLEAMDDGQLSDAENYLTHARQLQANPMEIAASAKLEKLNADKK